MKSAATRNGIETINCKKRQFCKRQKCPWQKWQILQKTGGETMQTLKTIVADKYFWLGVLLGFALGVLHHYYAL